MPKLIDVINFQCLCLTFVGRKSSIWSRRVCSIYSSNPSVRSCVYVHHKWSILAASGAGDSPTDFQRTTPAARSQHVTKDSQLNVWNSDWRASYANCQLCYDMLICLCEKITPMLVVIVKLGVIHMGHNFLTASVKKYRDSIKVKYLWKSKQLQNYNIKKNNVSLVRIYFRSIFSSYLH